MKTRNYRKSAVLIAAFLMSFIDASYAQNIEIEEGESVRNAIEHIFEHIDKSKVPTGLLRDYSTDMIDLSLYDGVQVVDSNFVDSGILNLILRGIRSSSVGSSKPFPKVSSIFANHSAPAGNIREIKSTNICLAAFQYNYLPEDAVTGGKIDYTDGQVYDRYSSDGSWINPYDSAYLLAFSPFENYLPTGNVTFRFPPECILSNLNISSIEFDSGTGNGYTTVQPGGSVTAKYYDESIYDLAIRVTLKGGQVLVAHSKISAVDCPMPIYAANDDPLESEHEFSYGSKPVKAKVTLKRQVLGSVTKPFIIVNGFYPNDISDDESSWSIYDDKYAIKISENTYLASYTADKDLVCVDWENCEASIEENGELLIQIINWVNSIKTGDEPNVVMGESMGGLVARYALRTMELSGTPHQTAMYISYDSPHQGVNVPIGAQYLVAYLYDFASRYKLAMKVISASPIGTINGKPLTDYLSLLDKYIYSSGTSANQMMCSHIDKSFNLDNADHINWQNKLKKLGLPKGDAGNYITNVAYSNGSPDLYPYWDKALVKFNFTAESKWFVDLLGGKAITDLLLPFFPNAFSKIGLKTLLRLPGRYRIDVQATADSHRSKGQNNIAKFRIQFTKKLLWCIPLKIDIVSYANNAPSSVIPLDNKLGSLYSPSHSLKGIEHEDLRNPGKDSSITAIKYNYSYKIVDTVMFVPTSSALDIEATKESVYNSSSYYYNTGVKESPFNYCYVAGRYGPNDHVDIDDSFYSKLISISNNADIEIVGDEYPHYGSTYSLSAYVKGPVTWSVDKDWAQIDSNGKVSMTGQYGGTLAITASWTEDGVTYTKSKTVFLGIPKYTLKNKLSLLSNQTTNIEIHDVLVSAVSSDVYFMKNANEVRYEWGYRLATSDSITWEESSSNSFSMASGGVFVYIYLKVKLKNFESETYSMRFVPSPPREPIELQSNGSGNNISSCANNSNVPVIYLIVNNNGSIVVTDDSGKIIPDEDTHSIISSEKVRDELNKVKPYGESAYSQSTIRLNGNDYMVRVINKNF